jgi:hypothetical protein
MEREPAGFIYTRTDRYASLLLFVLLSSIYFATVSGITSSNDGSHYALTRTMMANKHFTLDQFDDYAEGNDIAIRDGRLYSDRPPGTALAATVFYTIGGWLPRPLAPLASRHDAANPRLPYVLLLPVWAGAATAVLLYLLMRRLGVAMPGALTAALMFGLGTAHWKYSTVLYSHALSAFLVVLALYIVTKNEPDRADHGARSLALGLVLGLAVLVEYSNVLLVMIVGLYALFSTRPFMAGRLARKMALLGAGGALPAVGLGYYNSINFGGPFVLSYAYAVNYPWAGAFASTFNFPLGPGLRALLFWGQGGGWCNGPCYNQGLFLLSPLLLLAIPGLPLYARRKWRAFSLTTGLFLVYLMLFARHHTAHGFTADGRYLVPFLGLLVLPLGFFLEQVFAWRRRPMQQTLVYLLIYGLFFWSLRTIFLHIGFSYNYHLELARLEATAASPANWSYLLRQVFGNTGNLPLLWLLEGIGLLLWLRPGRQWLRPRRNEV